MSAKKLLQVLGAAFLLSLGAMPAVANIFLDENFEGAVPFVDQNWPIRDQNTTPPSNTAIQNTQGVNLRCFDSSAAQTLPKVVMNNSGTLSTTYAYSGTKSLQLASGQSMAVNGNAAYCNAVQGWYNFVQFAVTVNAATLALPASTQVGHFKMNYTTDNPQVLTTAEVTYSLNFVRNATGGMDIQVVCTPNATTPVKVGEIPAAGQWTMVSVMVQKQIDSEGSPNWECWDPLTTTYKGPQPTGNPIGTGSGGGTGTYVVMPDGFHVFINSNTEANRLSTAQVGANFCNSPAQNTGSKAADTLLLNWEIAAENSGTLFVDEAFWAHGCFQTDGGVQQETKEGAARLNAFTGVVPAGVEDWNLYM